VYIYRFSFRFYENREGKMGFKSVICIGVLKDLCIVKERGWRW
jgi:hypothetical protein